jgi:hypothetical protein
VTNYIQKLGDNKIGFTLTNGVLITRSSFQFVSKVNIVLINKKNIILDSISFFL